MKPAEVVVAGAGVMGLWTALSLRERGLGVTVVDPWEPGHPRGTSSSESRIIRCLYGGDEVYAAWAWASLAAWERHERELGATLLHKTGVLWLAREETSYEAAGEAALARLGIPLERLGREEIVERFPEVSCGDLAFALYEPHGGALLARESMRRLAAAIERRGVRFRRGAATPAGSEGGRLAEVSCGGAPLGADAFVFACGPWLPRIFPDVVGDAIRVYRAEELYFGVPAGHTGLDAPRLPTWVEIGSYYGVGGLDGRGFKVGVDRPGDAFDPTDGERRLSPEVVPAVRAYLARRFPAMADAPLVDGRVCTYELTVDEHLVIDRHPDLANVWIVGGGSGHAFKLGPAIGEAVAALVAGETAETLPRFRLARRAPRAWREA